MIVTLNSGCELQKIIKYLVWNRLNYILLFLAIFLGFYIACLNTEGVGGNIIEKEYKLKTENYISYSLFLH